MLSSQALCLLNIKSRLGLALFSLNKFVIVAGLDAANLLGPGCSWKQVALGGI